MSGVVDRNVAKKVVVKKKEHFFDRKLLWFTSLFVVFAVLVYTYPPGGTVGVQPVMMQNSGDTSDLSGAPNMGGDFFKEFGHELMSRGVYAQAVEYYGKYLDRAVPSKENAALAFQAGDIAKDHLKDYEKAIAFYLLVKHFDSSSPLLQKTGLRIVACLEALGKNRESQAQLNQMVNIDAKGKKASPFSPIVAETGSRNFTLADIDDGIASLPPEMKKNYEGPMGRTMYLQQHLLMPHLFYELGKKQGLRDDKAVQEKLAEVEKNLVVQQVISNQLTKMEMPTDEELQMFYKANAEKYENDFEKNKGAIVTDYVNFVNSQKIGRLLNEQMKLQNVRVYQNALMPSSDVPFTPVNAVPPLTGGSKPRDGEQPTENIKTTSPVEPASEGGGQ